MGKQSCGMSCTWLHHPTWHAVFKNEHICAGISPGHSCECPNVEIGCPPYFPLLPSLFPQVQDPPGPFASYASTLIATVIRELATQLAADSTVAPGSGSTLAQQLYVGSTATHVVRHAGAYELIEGEPAVSLSHFWVGGSAGLDQSRPSFSASTSSPSTPTASGGMWHITTLAVKGCVQLIFWVTSGAPRQEVEQAVQAADERVTMGMVAEGEGQQQPGLLEGERSLAHEPSISGGPSVSLVADVTPNATSSSNVLSGSTWASSQTCTTGKATAAADDYSWADRHSHATNLGRDDNISSVDGPCPNSLGHSSLRQLQGPPSRLAAFLWRAIPVPCSPAAAARTLTGACAMPVHTWLP